MSLEPRRDARIRVFVMMDTLAVGGIEVFILNLLRSLDPERFESRIVCLRGLGPMAPRYEEAGIPVTFLGWRAREPKTLPRLVRWFRKERPDVIFTAAEQTGALLMGRLAGKLARVPAQIVTTHCMGEVSRSVPRWTMETIFASDALVMLAPSHREHIARTEGLGSRPWRRTREVLIPYGTELGPRPGPEERARARDLLGLAEDEVAVGMVATMRADKAHDVLIDAVDLLRARHPKLRLVLIGAGDRMEVHQAQVAALGMGDVVRFMGRRSDVAELLPGLDVKCLASYPVFETLPLSVVEAMAAALPVVATRCGALADMITPGVEGDLVPIGDRDALAAALEPLVADAALRRRMGDAARARAEREFTLERMVDDYERLFEELVGRRTPDRRPTTAVASEPSA